MGHAGSGFNGLYLCQPNSSCLIFSGLNCVILHSCQPNMSSLLSMSSKLCCANLFYKQVVLGLKRRDTIIKWVVFVTNYLVE